MHERGNLAWHCARVDGLESVRCARPHFHRRKAKGSHAAAHRDHRQQHHRQRQRHRTEQRCEQHRAFCRVAFAERLGHQDRAHLRRRRAAADSVRRHTDRLALQRRIEEVPLPALQRRGQRKQRRAATEKPGAVVADSEEGLVDQIGLQRARGLLTERQRDPAAFLNLDDLGQRDHGVGQSSVKAVERRPQGQPVDERGGERDQQQQWQQQPEQQNTTQAGLRVQSCQPDHAPISVRSVILERPVPGGSPNPARCAAARRPVRSSLAGARPAVRGRCRKCQHPSRARVPPAGRAPRCGRSSA